MADLTYTELLSIMAAAFSDADTKKRLAEIQAALQLQNEAQAAAAALVAEANEMRANATRIAALTETERQTLAGERAALEKFERTLSEHNQTLIAEKTEWEKIRLQVDTEQKAKTAELEAWEQRLALQEAGVLAGMQELEQRERAAKELDGHANAKIVALRSALEMIDPAPAEQDAA